jgi:carboxymethylenebutenolidase
MLRSDLDPAPALTSARGTGVGFAVTMQPVAAHTIVTDTAGLVAGEVTIKVGDFDLPAYRARPEGDGGFPIVVVVSEIFGVHEHIADVVRRFAKLGYLAVAPELFVRQGDAKATTDINTLFATIISNVPDAQVMADIDASIAWAKANGGDAARLGITGFCWGGRVTWVYAAHNPALKAGVAWYGPVARAYAAGDRSPVDMVASIKAPMLGLYGGADGGIPNDTVDKMRDALKAAGNTKSEFVIYPDTPHAFHADYRPSYRKAAADDGWQRALAWFKANGVA